MTRPLRPPGHYLPNIAVDEVAAEARLCLKHRERLGLDLSSGLCMTLCHECTICESSVLHFMNKSVWLVATCTGDVSHYDKKKSLFR